MEGQCSRTILQMAMLVFLLQIQKSCAASVTIELEDTINDTVVICRNNDSRGEKEVNMIATVDTDSPANVSQFYVRFRYPNGTLGVYNHQPWDCSTSDDVLHVFKLKITFSVDVVVVCSYNLDDSLKQCNVSEHKTVTVKKNVDCPETTPNTNTGQPVIVPGGDCTSNQEGCVEGLACIDNNCTDRIVPGGDCTSNQEGCVEGLACIDNNCTDRTTTEGTTTQGNGIQVIGAVKQDKKFMHNTLYLMFTAAAVLVIGALVYGYLAVSKRPPPPPVEEHIPTPVFFLE